MFMSKLSRAVATVVPGALLCVAVASGQYAPPADYYLSATGLGATLKSNLHLIVQKDYWNPASTAPRFRSYDDLRQALQITDLDPNDPTKIVLFYTGNSVNKTWDAGATYNREHTWPRSLGVGESGPDNSDMNMVRPCDPGTNGSRGNLPYGSGPGYFDPLAFAQAGANHRGDAARIIFYGDMRYDGGESSTVDLTVVSGLPGSNQMGDLVRMLQWHYEDPVDDYERRRNHFTFDKFANPSYYQGNRNPFIDRPEFVWAIWGPTPNSSTIFVGGSPGADGSSTELVTLRALVGAPIPQESLLITKAGATPTTYDLFVSGPITIDSDPQGRAFPYDTQQTSLLISAQSTATPGLFVGVVTVDNTDLTSAAPGQGAADADDTVTVMVDVLAHSFASLDGAVPLPAKLVAVEVDQFGPAEYIDVPVHNLGGGPAQAMLDVDAVTGLTAPFSTLEPLPTSISSTPGNLTVVFNPAGLSPGVYNASALVSVSDEDLPGALSGSLTLDFQVTVVAPCFGDANGDDLVDFNDITSVLANWLAVYSPGTGPGDANADGVVDFTDVSTVLGNFLNACN